MRKLLAVLLVAVMLVTTAACASKENSSETDTAKSDNTQTTNTDTPKEDITLTFMASQDWIQDAEITLGEKFTEETGIKVDYQIIPADQYFNLLLAKLNSGECTDIFGSQAGKFDIVTQLNVEKNAVDLSNEEWVSRLDPLAAVEVSVNGKVYGQPLQDLSNVWAVAYNKKIFKELNLEVPKTYAQFKEVCEAIKNAGIIPIYECVSDGWHHVLWFAEMGVAIEKNEPGLAEKLNNNEAKFVDSPTAKLIIEQIKDMVDSGYWGDNYMDSTYADAPKFFAEGKYAMFVANQGFPTEVNQVDSNFKPEDVGFFVIPLADNQVLNVNPVGPTRFIYSGSKHIDAAKKYFEFIARPENLQYLIDNVPKFNTLPISGAQAKYTDEIKAFYDSYPERGTVYQVAVKYVNPQWMDMGKDLVSVILGESDAKKMLESIDKRRAEQAAAANDPAWN